MLLVDRAAVEAVGKATSAADLVGLVQEAVRLEFSTIPPYLTAMLSLKPRQNRLIWWAIHDVVVDEMLHMLIGCNLLNALGARPALDAAEFVPTYPGPLPLGIGTGLQVGLLPFSLDVVENVFMEIEEPEQPIAFDGPAEGAPEFATIGEFYRTLSGTLATLGDQVLVGEPGRQVVAPQWFAAERLFAITDVASAARALNLIVEEGEGTEDAPVDPDGDIAHYYRFQAITKDARLIGDDTVPEGFSFTGAPYGFEPDGVWPLTPNQQHDALLVPGAGPGDRPRRTEAWRRVQQFRVVFTRLLAALQRVVDGEPEHLDAAMGVMFELKLAGQVLAATPAGPGRNAGPVFVRAVINE